MIIEKVNSTDEIYSLPKKLSSDNFIAVVAYNQYYKLYNNCLIPLSESEAILYSNLSKDDFLRTIYAKLNPLNESGSEKSTSKKEINNGYIGCIK